MSHMELTEQKLTRKHDWPEGTVLLASVKMLTYNHRNYISKAINGVLNQSVNFPFELVIGEDCSTDGTREIVFDFAKRHPEIIRVVTSESNVGSRANSNRVSAKLRGKYILWCEGDDYWQSNDKMQRQIDFLEQNPEYGLTCSDYDQHYTKTGLTKSKFFGIENGEIPKNPSIIDILSARGGIMTCTVAARRAIIDKISDSDHYLYKSGHFKMGDTQLWSEISLVSKIHHFDDSFAVRNILSESATQSKNENKALEFWISNAEMCVYLCDKHKLPEALKLAHISIIRNNSLRIALNNRDSKLAIDTAKKYPGLTLKERLLYIGATVPPLQNVIRFIFKSKQSLDRFRDLIFHNSAKSIP